METAVNPVSLFLDPAFFRFNARSRFVSQIICISQMSYRSEKSSNDRKVARIAPVWTIFGPIESQRHDLFLKKISNARNGRKVFVRFVRANLFSEIDSAVAIQSVRKSSKSELFSRLFGHLTIFRSDGRFLRHKITELQISSHG